MFTCCFGKRSFVYASDFFLLGTFQPESVLFSAERQTGNHNYQFSSCCFLADPPIRSSICSVIPFPQFVSASSSWILCFLANFDRNCRSNCMARNCHAIKFIQRSRKTKKLHRTAQNIHQLDNPVQYSVSKLLLSQYQNFQKIEFVQEFQVVQFASCVICVDGRTRLRSFRITSELFKSNIMRQRLF